MTHTTIRTPEAFTAILAVPAIEISLADFRTDSSIDSAVAEILWFGQKKLGGSLALPSVRTCHENQPDHLPDFAPQKCRRQNLQRPGRGARPGADGRRPR